MPVIPQTASVTQSLPPALTIRNAASVADLLISRFEHDGPIELTISEDAEIDLSFVQLLLSARAKARLEGRIFRLQNPASGSLLSILERGGLLNDAAEDVVEFWLHRKGRK